MLAKQEVRIAVVMYGGVSLCIYIHGVAQELLRLVRSTSRADISGDPVSQIYRDLSTKMRDLGGTGALVETRFVVDLLSGTSAGGINAVFLAKALAVRARNLDPLRHTWVDKADMSLLLNSDADPFTAKRSLLKGQWMYRLLYEAFGQIDRDVLDKAEGYQQAQEIDLFVTTTDLNGVEVPIRLADEDVIERVHKGLFHFRFDPREVAPTLPPTNQFTAIYNGMLAFAARCTSSFPIAFAPMKLTDTKDIQGDANYGKTKELAGEFFGWVPEPAPAQSGAVPLGFADRPLADGGYLDNKPFGHVVDALTYRASDLPHSRKLFYVDPFPERPGQRNDEPHINFVDNATLAAMDLPRYQTIREELERIKQANQTQERLASLRDKAKLMERMAGTDTTSRGDVKPADGSPQEDVFARKSVSQLVRLKGPAYSTYHITRVDNTTDDLAHVFATTAGTADQEDLYLAIRYIASIWRRDIYDAEGANSKQPENEFLEAFDFSFRLRRAIYLLEYANQHCGQAVRDSLITQITRLRRCRDKLCRRSADNPIVVEILRLNFKLTWPDVKSILRCPAEGDRRVEAAKIFEGNKAAFLELTAAVAREWKAVVAQNRKELKALRAADPDFNDRYCEFDEVELMSLTFLEGSDVREYTKVDIHRISPDDGIVPKTGDKLAGHALGAFGAYLHRPWRENDILWGRLDAAEKIVCAMLPDDADRDTRDDIRNRLHIAIVNQENSLRQQDDSSLAPVVAAGMTGVALAVERYLKDQYQVPKQPPNHQLVKQAAQATDILGRMIEEDIGSKAKPAAFLKTFGGTVAGLVAFLTPGTAQRVFWNYWVALLGTMFVLLIVGGWLFDKTEVGKIGKVGAAATAALFFVFQGFGAALAAKGIRSTPVMRTALWIVLIAVLILAGIGVWQFPQFWSLII